MSTTVKAANWRYVEIGRVVLIDNSKLATIVDIIDQKRVLIDGPNVERQAIALAKVVLTQIVVPGLERDVSTDVVSKKWASEDVDAKWAASSWAKKLAVRQKRASLSDFERFQVMVLRKQRRDAMKKLSAK